MGMIFTSHKKLSLSLFSSEQLKGILILFQQRRCFMQGFIRQIITVTFILTTTLFLCSEVFASKKSNVTTQAGCMSCHQSDALQSDDDTEEDNQDNARQIQTH
jgi:hypothetical protein